MSYPGASFPGGDLALHIVSEDKGTLTIGWDAASSAGYRFDSENGRRSHTWDTARRTVRFAKGSSWYRVEALDVSASGEIRPE